MESQSTDISCGPVERTTMEAVDFLVSGSGFCLGATTGLISEIPFDVPVPGGPCSS